MKSILALILVAVSILGCSSAKTGIIASKIRKKEHPVKKEQMESPEIAMQILARNVGETFRRQDTHNQKIRFDPVACFKRPGERSINTYLDGLLREHLVRESKAGRFYLVENQSITPDSVLGTRILTIDYRLKLSCLPMQKRIKITARLIEEQTAKTAAVHSVWITETDWSTIGEFVVFPGWVYDSVTRLYWNRDANNIGYTFEEARSYCGGLVTNGFKDWRMPVSDEIYSLITRPLKHKRSVYRYDQGYFQLQRSCHWFFEGTKGSKSAYAVNLDTGKLVSSGPLNTRLGLLIPRECQVKCVRNESAKIQDSK